MGHVVKRGGKWLARWRGPDGQEHSRSFARKLDAERFLTTVAADILRGTYIDPRAGKVTLEAYASAWAEAQVWRRASRVKNEIALRRHILPSLGARPIGSIRTTELQAWVTGLSGKGLAPLTVQAAYRVLAAVLRAATVDRLIPASPAVGVRLPRREDGRIVPLTVEQVAALTGAMLPRYRVAIPVAAGLGLRRGELLGLTVDRVDFLRRQVTIDRQHNGVAFSAPKTRKSVRTIPLPATVADTLAAHLADVGPGAHGLVLSRPDGRPLGPSVLHHEFDAARQAAGVGARFHDLRHFTASALIASGCSPVAVASYLGHESPNVTLGIYGHLWPSDDDAIRASIDVLFEGHAGSTRDTAGG